MKLASAALGQLAVLAVASPCPAQCGLKLHASDGDEGRAFGSPLGLSSDYAIVGARSNLAAWQAGSAYVFDATTGKELHALLASDAGAYDYFGGSVATDEEWVVVAAPGHSHAGGPSSGAAYVYDAVTGLELLELTPSDGQNDDQFGSVAIRGNLLVVGAPWSGSKYSGAAYAFDLPTGTELFKLTASDGGLYDRFGASVAIGDGLIAVGSRFNEEHGAVYVYDATTGQELIKLTPSDGNGGDQFGTWVAVGDGHVAVSAPFADVASIGAVYVFDVATGAEVYRLTGPLSPRRGPVAIDQGRLLVGAPLFGEWGAVFLFDLPTGELLLELGASDVEEGELGGSIALAGDLALVGNWRDGDQGWLSGAAYLFPLESIGTVYCGPGVPNSTGAPAVIRVAGCDIASENFLKLVASELPPNKQAYFLASRTQGFVTSPGGSQGNLCLGGDIARFVKHVKNSGDRGWVSVQIDLGNIPTNPPSAVMAGETWSFQCWYRDKNPDPTSNFTDGIAVTFQQ